ncbi:MAG TPA: hypothetical protein VFK20_10840 [Vicinamibacterales bacterium]|nr:hypothetical protein [Vicinamibacterales bacterium]
MKRSVLFMALVFALAPAPARAHTLLSELIVKMLLSDIVLAPPSGPFQSHEAHFRPILGTGEVASGFDVNQLEIPLAINATIISQLSSVPLGSSSGGFAYSFDPALGTFSRESRSFGSTFAERALTAGRGKWNLGFNFQRATFDTLEGKGLDNGDVRVYLVHQDCCGERSAPGSPPDPFFEGDVIENRLSLRLTSSVFSAYANYGVTDRLDVGLLVPYVTIRMRAQADAHIIRLATSDIPTIHSFDGHGSSEDVITESSSAEGIGDILLRGKLRVFDAAGGGIAAALDLRLPTGDSEQLLGSGGVQTKVSFIGSMAAGPFAPHVNIGYTFSNGHEPAPLPGPTPAVPDEISYIAGFDLVLHDRLTVSADVLGRTLRDIGRLVPVNRQFSFETRDGGFGTATFEEFSRRPGDLNQSLLATGLRFNVRGNLLLSANVLVSMSNAGLRDKITPVIGGDYSF